MFGRNKSNRPIIKRKITFPILIKHRKKFLECINLKFIFIGFALLLIAAGVARGWAEIRKYVYISSMCNDLIDSIDTECKTDPNSDECKNRLELYQECYQVYSKYWLY